jgi:hypothetical protein
VVPVLVRGGYHGEGRIGDGNRLRLREAATYALDKAACKMVPVYAHPALNERCYGDLQVVLRMFLHLLVFCFFPYGDLELGLAGAAWLARPTLGLARRIAGRLGSGFTAWSYVDVGPTSRNVFTLPRYVLTYALLWRLAVKPWERVYKS